MRYPEGLAYCRGDGSLFLPPCWGSDSRWLSACFWLSHTSGMQERFKLQYFPALRIRSQNQTLLPGSLPSRISGNFSRSMGWTLTLIGTVVTMTGTDGTWGYGVEPVSQGEMRALKLRYTLPCFTCPKVCHMVSRDLKTFPYQSGPIAESWNHLFQISWKLKSPLSNLREPNSLDENSLD